MVTDQVKAPVVPRALRITAIVLVGVLTLTAVSGYLLFARAHSDPAHPVDAIIVLGGEHDGREDYGVGLAERGYAPTVVLSDPYPADDPAMRRLCAATDLTVEVICARPDPSTTRGEALFTRRLAEERGWQSVLLVTWRYHLPRARFIFNSCLAGLNVAVSAHAVEREYDYSPLEWELTYLYQYAGFAKAIAQGDCAEAPSGSPM